MNKQNNAFVPTGMRVTMLKIPATLICTCLLWFACKKEKSIEGSAKVDLGNCNYRLYGKGSSSTLETILNTGEVFTETATVDKDTSINNTRFTRILVQSSVGIDTVYEHCNNGAYFRLGKGNRRGIGVDDYFVLNYLYVDQLVGTAWNDTIRAATVFGNAEAVLYYKIEQTGMQKVVHLDTFQNVIQIRTDYKFTVTGFPEQSGYFSTSYYAPLVGEIETDRETDTTRIKSYHIND
ncbi:hypothetical protein [Chitinophaga skermanii]|uniref:hypothetical protein n=1 Tax=Chitinophaga skermanii TaxID=331697 RepID=UPI0011E5BAF8|nr:hypothetical protein [Chitinophaga skermanii]